MAEDDKINTLQRIDVYLAAGFDKISLDRESAAALVKLARYGIKAHDRDKKDLRWFSWSIRKQFWLMWGLAGFYTLLVIIKLSEITTGMC